MSITLQDVAMILGLPLEGNAVTGMIQSDGWRDMVQAQVGIRPPEPPEGVKNRKTSGVSCNNPKIHIKKSFEFKTFFLNLIA